MRSPMIKVQVLLLSSAICLSCSKHSQVDLDEISSKAVDPIKTIEHAPMPKDSLQLDSLKRQGFL